MKFEIFNSCYGFTIFFLFFKKNSEEFWKYTYDRALISDEVVILSRSFAEKDSAVLVFMESFWNKFF